MYNYKLLDNEEIKLIMDDVLILSNHKLYTFIITNMRLLVLDYPSDIHNSMEDLRISGRTNYVKMKEILFEEKLINIKKIILDNDMVTISFKDDKELSFIGHEIYNVLNSK